jgi:hypothetical protein
MVGCRSALSDSRACGHGHVLKTALDHLSVELFPSAFAVSRCADARWRRAIFRREHARRSSLRSGAPSRRRQCQLRASFLAPLQFSPRSRRGRRPSHFESPVIHPPVRSSCGVQNLTTKAAGTRETCCRPQCHPFSANVAAAFSCCLNPPKRTAPSGYAASCASKPPGWREPRLRSGRFRFRHRRCPCAGPVTPCRALALDRARSRRPSRFLVVSPVTIAASAPVGDATAELHPEHATVGRPLSVSERASRPSKR